MIRLFANANYDFIKWRRWAYGLTAAIIIPGFALFLVHGLNYSIEFTGGTLIQVQTTQPVGTDRLRAALDAAGIRDAEIKQFGTPTDYVVTARLGTGGVTAEGSTQATAAAVDSALARGVGAGQYAIVRTEAVGPKVGRELQGKAFLAIFFSFIVTLIYLAFRFEWRFGLAAVLATFHDILTTIAFIRYLDLEVSLVVVGAVLTLESMMALMACVKPSSTAVRTSLPCCSSSRMRSKISTFASTAIPTESTSPASPGRVRVKPNAASPASVNSTYSVRAETASAPDHR